MDDQIHKDLLNQLEIKNNLIASYENDFRKVFEKLEAGTMHMVYCNANHNSRIGTKGTGCSCPLGRIIRELEMDLEEANNTILTLEKEIINKDQEY